jgi:hypothetical protein
MAHGDAREGKWMGNWRMEWIASTLRTTSERGVSNITTANAHTSAASSRLNWRPCRFKWTRPFHRKTKSGFCACAITFQTQSTYSECVSVACYASSKAHARCCHRWPVWLYHFFPQYLINGTIKKKIVIEQKMCFVFLYSSFFLIFLILRRIEREVFINAFK